MRGSDIAWTELGVGIVLGLVWLLGSSFVPLGETLALGIGLIGGVLLIVYGRGNARASG